MYMYLLMHIKYSVTESELELHVWLKCQLMYLFCQQYAKTFFLKAVDTIGNYSK